MSLPAAAVAGSDTPPDASMVRAWLSLPTSSITDPQLELLLEVEEAAQAALCTIDPWSPPLTQALYRRCGRAVAATGAPLGIVDGGEYGTATVPRWDAEIERYEAPFRKMLLG